MSYREEAKECAQDMALEFLDEIVENILDTQGASLHYADYSNGDEYHHESHIDRDYNLTEAAEILDELYQYEETDSGLWQGLEPRRAVCWQAAYTFSNAVASFFQHLIKEINDDQELNELLNPEPEILGGGCTPTRMQDVDEVEVNAEAVKARIKVIIDEF